MNLVWLPDPGSGNQTIVTWPIIIIAVAEEVSGSMQSYPTAEMGGQDMCTACYSVGLLLPTTELRVVPHTLISSLHITHVMKSRRRGARKSLQGQRSRGARKYIIANLIHLWRTPCLFVQ